MARDATSRLYDVDANLTVLDKKAGTITFAAKKGHYVSLDQLHESIWATRLGDRTGMRLHVLMVTTKGKAMIADEKVVLKIPDRDAYFVLKDDPKAKSNDDKPTAYQKLRDAVRKGPKRISVTGVVDGWQGNFTKFLRKLPASPRTIVVKEFKVIR